MADIKKNKNYREYMQFDNPSFHMPKTTKWRYNKRMRQNENAHGRNSCIVNHSNENDDHEPRNPTASENGFKGSCTASAIDHSSYDPETDVLLSEDAEQSWFKMNEETEWFDATDANEIQLNEPEENLQESINDEKESLEDKPIHHGAPISVAQSAILILSFAFRHNLTGECLSDLLTLISLHCITTSFLHLSLYRFRSYFSTLKSPLVFHKFCSNCEVMVDATDKPCCVCGSDLSEKNSTSYFVEIPLVFQLQQFFKRPDFHPNLTHRFVRKKKFQNNIEDIYDGILYKRFSSEGGFLSSCNNISLMWYTDGVPLFKSSKISIWPLFFAVNELPIQERFKQENIMFAGLWFGRSKPSMLCFLKPFYESLIKFRDTGFEINCSHCSTEITVKGLLLCGTCDLPAKCMVMNTTQFNGKYGCLKCTQEGNVIESGRGHSRVFPFNLDNADGPKRTHEEFIQHGDEACASSEPVCGVKGPSWWTNCCPDVINGTAIDYMHSVLLGLVRRLLQLWFDPKYSGESFSISNLVNVADKRLSEIKPLHQATSTRHKRAA